MKIYALIVILILLDLFYCQPLEAFIAGKLLHKKARIKTKAKDKKFVLYGVGAVVKGTKGTVQKVIGKPLKVIGVVLGPLGVPLKIAGKVLEGKAAANKVKSGVLTVKKLARDSTRYG